MDTGVPGSRGGHGSAREVSRRTAAKLMIAGVLASAIGIAIGLAIDWFPTSASMQARRIDTLFDVLIVVSVPIFTLVAAVVLFSAVRFRMRAGEEQADGPPIRGDMRLEVLWTAIPAVLILSLITYAYIVLTDIERAPAGRERVVRVTGQQFAWTFRFEEGRAQASTTQLHLPVNAPVKFLVRSIDVVHSFWVPAFRMKIDAVPGITTSYRVTPTRTGTFPAVCAELCGLGHAFMRSGVRIVSQREFDAWLARLTRRRPITDGAKTKPDARALLVSGNPNTGATACGACHTLADSGSTGRTGPNLDESLAGKDAAYIRRAILDPNVDVARGFGRGIMPRDYGEKLSAEEIDALVEYIDAVRRRR